MEGSSFQWLAFSLGFIKKVVIVENVEGVLELPPTAEIGIPQGIVSHVPCHVRTQYQVIFRYATHHSTIDNKTRVLFFGQQRGGNFTLW